MYCFNNIWDSNVYRRINIKSYKPYNSLMKILLNELGFSDPKEVLRLSNGKRRELCESLLESHRTSRFIAETLLRLHKIKPKRKKQE